MLHLNAVLALLCKRSGHLFILACILIGTTWLSPAKAQSQAVVTGTVTDTANAPIAGVNVSFKNSMYINAEVYAGTPRYSDAAAMCDSVITGMAYDLDASWPNVFAPDNGPAIKETIFAIPYDALLIPGQQFTRHGILAYLYPKYGVPSNLSVSMSTTPNFYDKFNLAGDERTNTWLVGKQYNNDGTPFTLTLKAKTLDASYPGTDKDTVWQVSIRRDLVMTGKKPFDLGNDYLARCMGIRSVKYYPDKATTAATRNSSNDVPVFRLADIYLLKAEAILRGAAASTVNGELQTPLVLVNKVRARVKAEPATDVTLTNLLDERGRELYWECWRRNDLIRFGMYETEYPIPGDIAVPGYTPGMDKSIDKRIFPIPASELKLNPNLQQNPGYQ